LVIVKPETLIGRHRKSFQLFWKGKSQAGRPRIPENIRNLIVQMAQENPTWGQARVSAELSNSARSSQHRALWPRLRNQDNSRASSSHAMSTASDSYVE
jgi:hypothetical protein